MATEITNGKQTIKLYTCINRGKPLYQLAYYKAGVRVLKNFTDKAHAKRVAKQILNGLAADASVLSALATHELESYVVARKFLAADYPLHVAVEEHAYAVRRLGKTPLREAIDFFLRHNRPDVPRLTLAEIAEQFARSREQSGLTASYVHQCRKTIARLAGAFPRLALPDLKTAEVDAWMGSLRLGAKSKNSLRTMLVVCGHWAEQHGHLLKDSSPFSGLVRYKEPNRPVPIFTPENIAGLLNKVGATLRPFLAIGAFAGLRISELQRLDWSEIDLDRGFIVVETSKTRLRRRRLAPISDNLKRWLLPRKQASGPVCLHRRPQMAAARSCEGFRWQTNGLRHSFISYRLAVLQDAAQVALEAGTAPDIIFNHYRELVTPEAAKAWFAIEPPPPGPESPSYIGCDA